MVARIYQPARNAMQSGKGKTKIWLLEYEATAPRERDPLMGWTSSGDMNQQLKLRFASKEAAIDYAKNNGIAYLVVEPAKSSPKAKSYADNFRFGRHELWTH